MARGCKKPEVVKDQKAVKARGNGRTRKKRRARANSFCDPVESNSLIDKLVKLYWEPGTNHRWDDDTGTQEPADESEEEIAWTTKTRKMVASNTPLILRGIGVIRWTWVILLLVTAYSIGPGVCQSQNQSLDCTTKDKTAAQCKRSLKMMIIFAVCLWIGKASLFALHLLLKKPTQKTQNLLGFMDSLCWYLRYACSALFVVLLFGNNAHLQYPSSSRQDALINSACGEQLSFKMMLLSAAAWMIIEELVVVSVTMALMSMAWPYIQPLLMPAWTKIKKYLTSNHL